MNFEKDLNTNQYEAVTTSFPHVRVIAGAGSGKTRVLTYRISYLISELNINPWKILAITFTNKVANEMKTRVVSMIPDCCNDLTIRTYHSFAANFLRREIRAINFPSTFTILDEEDQTKLCKDIASEMGFKRTDRIVTLALSYIGKKKLKQLYPNDFAVKQPMFEEEKTCYEIYTRYEEEKDKMYALDFDDLLLKTNYILENFPNIRSNWQQRIDHILIDEFQDTNDIEFKLLKLLLKPSSTLYVVGDPDQTIYTWRGANQSIILELNKQFPDIETIILDRNYRSTQNILNSANKLISQNKMRVHKNLYTEQNEGEKVITKRLGSGKSEAEFVAREISSLVSSKKYDYSDITLLYRSNYITVDFEQALTAHGIPYKIFGGTKFYQRKEIKDVLAYFHLVVNPKDDISFKRIINVPKRKIGEATENVIFEEAKKANKSIYNYLKDLDEKDSEIPKRVIYALKALIKRIEIAKEDLLKNEEVYSKILENLIISIGYNEYLLEDEESGDDRLENVKALFEDIRHYLRNNPDSTFDEYLQNITLLSAQDDIVEGNNVTLMTVHTAKGLEFPVVFVVRLNQGVFPHNRAISEGGYKALEEERRLAYVAFTRAKKKLYLTLSSSFSYVVGTTLGPSQFLKESGNEVLNNDSQGFFGQQNPRTYPLFNDGPNLGFKKDQPSDDFKQNFEHETNDITSWRVGDIVLHKKLGKGVVIALEGDDIISVNFEEHGVKSIMGNHPLVSKGGHEA